MNDGGGYEGQLEREKVKQIKNKRRGGKRGLNGGRQRERRTLSKRLRAEEKMNRELETERGIQRMNEDRERVREDERMPYFLPSQFAQNFHYHQFGLGAVGWTIRRAQHQSA